jgi:8-oxo-dGTP diphosphatase
VPVIGPLVGVSAVVVRDGLVVVGRRRGSHGAGSWAFPGGKVEPGEDPRDVACDEIPEPVFAPAASLLATGWRPEGLPRRGRPGG